MSFRQKANGLRLTLKLTLFISLMVLSVAAIYCLSKKAILNDFNVQHSANAQGKMKSMAIDT
ncbi:hypothetical protein G3341_01315 [Providencia vermicola]|uniref:hypothetical protein n=1 Tax=Providencia vermicola TaxID=333965 RepID=UPI0013A780F6|nr:hypothetical protein [Providencia vermicola]QIC14429.1 hypothetical protein G3341_01315 [Providencia vermicola]